MNHDPTLRAEWEEIADAIVFWEAAATHANSPEALAYAHACAPQRQSRPAY
jgi:microcystin degradation protein MlrC